MGLFDGLISTFRKKVQGIFSDTNEPTIMPQFDNSINKLDPTTKELFLNFFNLGNTKADIINKLDDIKDFYFTQLIIDRIIEDALSPSANSDLLKISVKSADGKVDKALTNYLRDFQKNMNLKKILLDVSYDLLLYGEYALRLDAVPFNSDSHNKGVLNIHDDVDLTNLIPVYKDGGISYFLTVKDKKLQRVAPSEYTYFILPGNRIKVKIDGLDNKTLYLRMGKSIIFPVYGLLKELRFLEELTPMQFIKKFFKTKLLGVSVPNKVKPSEAIEITKIYQKLINNVLMQDMPDNDEALLNELKNKAGDVKVIPNFDNKGQLEQIDLNGDDNTDEIFDKIVDLRKNILITIGIPASIIDEEGIKSDVIRNHIRYTKKLKMLQQALIEGLRDLYIIHLQNSGFTNVTREDISINFLNVLDTQDIEKLEFLDLQISMLDNFKSFVDDMKEEEHIKLNEKEYVNLINGMFEKIIGFNLFEYTKEETEEGKSK